MARDQHGIRGEPDLCALFPGRLRDVSCTTLTGHASAVVRSPSDKEKKQHRFLAKAARCLAVLGGAASHCLPVGTGLRLRGRQEVAKTAGTLYLAFHLWSQEPSSVNTRAHTGARTLVSFLKYSIP